MKKKTDIFREVLKKARDSFEKEHYERSVTMYLRARKMVHSKKDRAIIWAELSWVYYRMSDYNKAIMAAENVLQDNPQYKALADIYRILGFSYIGLKDIVSAEHMLVQSLHHDSDSDKQKFVKYELGKLYFIQGDYDKAFPYFNELYTVFKETNVEDYMYSTMFYLGFIYYYLNNIESARHLFNQIITEKPKDEYIASAYYGLAYLEYHEKNFMNVISLCEKIITIREDFFDKESIGFLTASSYFQLGRHDIFLEFYSQMIKSYPNGRYRSELDNMYNSTNKST